MSNCDEPSRYVSEGICFCILFLVVGYCATQVIGCSITQDLNKAKRYKTCLEELKDIDPLKRVKECHFYEG